VNVVKTGIRQAQYLKDGSTYFEDVINPEDGGDWNFEQHRKVNLIRIH